MSEKADNTPVPVLKRMNPREPVVGGRRRDDALKRIKLSGIIRGCKTLHETGQRRERRCDMFSHRYLTLPIFARHDGFA